jgi:predicted RNA polymerase sigma factor
MKLGRFTEARHEIERAIAMTQNSREQQLLTEKLSRLPAEPGSNISQTTKTPVQ